MSRTLRGAWSRRGTLVPLLLLTAVVVAGVVAVTALADASDTSVAVAVPLLVLGLVAVPATGRQLAVARRQEIAMARLRGITGGQLYVVLALEPLLVLLVGAVLGVAAGVGVVLVAASAWVGVGSVTFGVAVLPPVVLVLVVGLVALLAGMAGAMRESLVDQVSVAERPRAASAAGLFWSVLLIVAAVVASYRAAVAGADDPGWVVLAGPALVGLAVGQLAVWGIRLTARAAVPWTAGRGLRGFLASRRLARLADAATPVRLVVAAAAVAAVALTGAQQVTAWTDTTSRLRAGAAYRVDVPGDVDDALQLTRRLDPEGQWLMAAALVPGEGSVVARRAFLDTERYDAVVGDFLDQTPAASVARQITDLRRETGVGTVTGDRITGSVRGVSARPSGRLQPRVAVDYTMPDGQRQTAAISLELGPDGGPEEFGIGVGCAEGCEVTGLTLARAPGDVARPWVLTSLAIGETDLLDATWVPTGRGTVEAPAGPLPVDDGLMVLADPRSQGAVPQTTDGATPVFATSSATWDGDPLLDSPGGDERPAEVLGRLPALPLVEADGLLADLPTASAGAPPTVPAAEVMVLAAADTPDDVLADLTEEAGEEPVPLDVVQDRIALEAGAVQSRIYALMAGFCLAVALLVLAASVAAERAAHRRETAALRVMGVPLRQVRGSGRREVGALAVAAVIATTAGGLLGVQLLLSNLSLVTVPLHAIPLEVGVATVPVAVAATAAALLVVLVGGRSRVVRPDQARPSILREED